MTSLGFLLDRSFIIALAIIGATIALVGSLLLGREGAGPGGSGRLVVRAGYAITAASVVLFIVAGFMSNR